MTTNGVFSLMLFSYTLPLPPHFIRIDPTRAACTGKRRKAENISSDRMTDMVMEKAWSRARRKQKKFCLSNQDDREPVKKQRDRGQAITVRSIMHPNYHNKGKKR